MTHSLTILGSDPESSHECPSLLEVLARVPYHCSWRGTEIGDLSTPVFLGCAVIGKTGAGDQGIQGGKVRDSMG